MILLATTHGIQAGIVLQCNKDKQQNEKKNKTDLRVFSEMPPSKKTLINGETSHSVKYQ